jgi:ATP-dependent Lon protease
VNDAVPDENGEIYCPVLIMRDIVVFPRMVSPIFITPGSNLEAINQCKKLAAP